MILSELKPGQSAVIRTVGGEGALRQHFLDMGLIPGVEVTMIKLAPMGDPMELRLHSYELTLRLADAEKIEAKEDSFSSSRSWGKWNLSYKGRREPSSGRRDHHFCPGRKSELWENDTL